MATFYRSDQALLHLNVVGISLPDVPWDKLEGAEKKAEGLAVFPGGSLDQVELGGIAKREPAKLSVKWSDSFIAVWKALDAIAGRGIATATYSVLDANYVPTGEGATYTGIVLEVTRPNYEAGKSEEALMLVTIGLNGPIS
jgi:hypothetical protein